MTHYGPFHGREHAMQGAGAARPLDARECQYRSGTHFVPGRSYPVTDVLHTTDKETTVSRCGGCLFCTRCRLLCLCWWQLAAARPFVPRRSYPVTGVLRTTGKEATVHGLSLLLFVSLVTSMKVWRRCVVPVYWSTAAALAVSLYLHRTHLSDSFLCSVPILPAPQSTEWQRKAIRKAVETPRATQMQGSLVAPEKPVEGPVYSKWCAKMRQR